MSKDRDPRKDPRFNDGLTFGFDHYRVVDANGSVVRVVHRLGQERTFTIEEYREWAKNLDSMTRGS